MINPTELKKSYQQAVIIAVSMIFGLLVFAGMVYYLDINGKKVVSSVNINLLRQASMGIIVLSLLSSFYLKNAILSQNRSPDPAAPKKDAVALQSQLMSVLIAPLGMCEGAVLFGIVVGYFSGNPQDLILPVVAGIIGFAVHFPHFDQWERWVQEWQK